MTAVEQDETFLQKQLRLKRERENATVTTTARVAAPVVVDIDNPRAQRWLEVKLQAQLDDLAAMPPGGRNHKLNAIAYSFGHYIPKWLDEQSVRQRLTDAALTAGLTPLEVRATLDSGLSSGMDEPRDPPVSTSVDGLADLVAGTVVQRLVEHATPTAQAEPETAEEDPLGSWAPVDLAAYLDGSYTPPQPCHLARSDGPHLIYPARVHWLSGEPEALKSWLGMLACSQALLRGERVVYLDLEDGAAGVTSRLLAMGVPHELLNSQFLYLAPHEPLNYTRKVHLEPLLDGASLLVIDACTESLALQQLSPKDDVDIASWLALLPRWAARQGLTVLVLDHVVKDTETRGRWATGSQHKLAGLDGVAFTLEAVQPGGKGMRGRSRLFVSKDRHGEVRPHTQRVKGGKDWVGDLVVDSSAGAFTEVVLEPPTTAASDQEKAPLDLAAEVSRVLARLDRPLTSKEIEDRVKGRSSDIRSAVAWLVDEGHISVETGARGAKNHTLTRPFPAVDEEAS